MKECEEWNPQREGRRGERWRAGNILPNALKISNIYFTSSDDNLFIEKI